MRRVMAYVALSVGFLLVFLSPLLLLYAVPRLEKAPVDHYDKVISDGTGVYFSTNPKYLTQIGPVSLENITTYRPDVAASSKDVAVYDSFSSTKDLRANAVIDASKERFVFDRKTALPVHCCGESPRHEGLTLKFPFDVQRKTYPFWDSTAKKAFPAKYVRDDTIDGLPVYEFQSEVTPTTIGHVTVSGAAAGQPDKKSVPVDQMYSSTTLVWIEPVTGAVVKGYRLLQQWLQDPVTGTHVLVLENVRIGYADRYVRGNVADISTSVDQLKLVKTRLPIFGPIVGVAFIILGLLLTRDRRSRRPRPRPAPATQPTTV
jgi:Porin PorA